MCISNQEPVFHNYLFSSGGYLVYVTDPELVRFVAVKSSHKFECDDFLAKMIPSVNRGLLATTGRVHSRQKRMIGSAFSSSNLRGFLNIFQENTGKLVQVLHFELVCEIIQ